MGKLGPECLYVMLYYAMSDSVLFCASDNKRLETVSLYLSLSLFYLNSKKLYWHECFFNTIVLLRCVWLGGARIDVLLQCQFNILLCFHFKLSLYELSLNCQFA